MLMHHPLSSPLAHAGTKFTIIYCTYLQMVDPFFVIVYPYNNIDKRKLRSPTWQLLGSALLFHLTASLTKWLPNALLQMSATHNQVSWQQCTCTSIFTLNPCWYVLYVHQTPSPLLACDPTQSNVPKASTSLLK